MVTALKQELIRLDAVPAEGGVIVPLIGREVHHWRKEDRARAAANACLHPGGPPECRDGEFVCPRHGASHDMATGMKLVGPGPLSARLMVLPVAVEEEALFYVWGK